VHLYYADPIHDSNRCVIAAFTYASRDDYAVVFFSRIGSFSVPVLEHNQTLKHHVPGAKI
jgi:hypothetical protein